MTRQQDIDWALWRSFLAIVRDGSLAGAARTLRLTHPTVRRHLEALEAALNAPLFTRSPSGLEPTALALELRPVAEAMEAASRDLVRRALSTGDEFAGAVRITASEVIGVEVLPPMLARLRARHPQISFEIQPTNQVEDVLRGDADIAVRMTRPKQGSLVAQRVATIDVGFFATKGLVARLPAPPAKLADLVASGLMVGYDRNPAIVEALRQMGAEVRREDFSVRADSDLVHLAAVRVGLGIGLIQVPLGARESGLVRLLPKARYPMEVWLVVNAQLARVPRIAATLDALKSGLAAYARPSRKARAPQAQ